MEKTVERVGYLKFKPNFFHLAVGIVLMISILFIYILLVSLFDNPAIVALAFFNLLFVFLLFPLDGSFRYKFILLISGNLVGVLWCILQTIFEQLFFYPGVEILKIIFFLVKPLTDFVWLVAFWSFSLSVLSSKKQKLQGSMRN
ncbi:MAG: hypothetical protein P8Y18_02925 [Candidatus Bathyarchaeota archaeon]